MYLLPLAPPCPPKLCTRFVPLVRDAAAWTTLHAEEEAELDRGNPGCSSCSTLPAGVLDAYAGRGWCRVEVMAALCPKRTLTGRWRRGPINVRYRFHHDANDPGIGPLLAHSPLFNPMEGGFTSETDRPIVVEITKRIASRYNEYVDSGSKAWDETLIMTSLPSWLTEAGRKGAVVTVTDDSKSILVATAPLEC